MRRNLEENHRAQLKEFVPETTRDILFLKMSRAAVVIIRNREISAVILGFQEKVKRRCMLC